MGFVRRGLHVRFFPEVCALAKESAVALLVEFRAAFRALQSTRYVGICCSSLKLCVLRSRYLLALCLCKRYADVALGRRDPGVSWDDEIGHGT